MSIGSILRRPRTWFIAIPVLIVIGLVAGPFIYINFIQEDPPERLGFTDTTAATDTGTSDGEDTTAGSDAEAFQGEWTTTDGTEAGYRVGEVLFGQDAEAVGRTSDVTGKITIDGTTLTAADFEVDLTAVASDEDRRDNQFQGRIMDTDSFPTATFVLTEPIDIGKVPADLEEVTVSATGDLTLRGATQSVTFDLSARINGDAIEVNGSIPITFADYGIPDATFGPATVQDHGEIEFLLILSPA
jgi:polyisoprenoid-binding protein YceI